MWFWFLKITAVVYCLTIFFFLNKLFGRQTIFVLCDIIFSASFILYIKTIIRSCFLFRLVFFSLRDRPKSGKAEREMEIEGWGVIVACEALIQHLLL